MRLRTEKNKNDYKYIVVSDMLGGQYLRKVKLHQMNKQEIKNWTLILIFSIFAGIVLGLALIQ